MPPEAINQNGVGAKVGEGVSRLPTAQIANATAHRAAAFRFEAVATNSVNSHIVETRPYGPPTNGLRKEASVMSATAVCTNTALPLEVDVSILAFQPANAASPRMSNP